MRLRLSASILLAPWILFTTAVADDAQSSADAPFTFVDHAKPILRQHCAGCHNGTKKSGDLDVTSYGGLMQGGSSGDVIEPGAADDSYLLSLVTHEDSPEMPPSGDKMPADQIRVIRKWINDGAIVKVGAKVRRKKKASFAMTVSPSTRPDTVAMPVGVPTTSSAIVVRAPLVASIHSSPWAPVIAVAAASQVTMYHADVANKNKVLGVLPWEFGKPNMVRFSRDGAKLLAAGGRSAAVGYVQVWDVASGDSLLRLGDELDAVLAAELSPAGDLIATGGPERAVRIYRLHEELSEEDADKPAYEHRDHTDWVTALAFSPDGKWLATGDRNGGLFLRQASSGDERFRLPSHKQAVTAIAWRSDSRMIATGSRSGKITLWNPMDGKAIKSFDAHKDGCSSLTFDRQGQLISGGRDQRVKLWSGKAKLVRTFEGVPEMVTAVAVNDETGSVFAGDFSGGLHVWNAKDGKRLGRLDFPVQ